MKSSIAALISPSLPRTGIATPPASAGSVCMGGPVTARGVTVRGNDPANHAGTSSFQHARMTSLLGGLALTLGLAGMLLASAQAQAQAAGAEPMLLAAADAAGGGDAPLTDDETKKAEKLMKQHFCSGCHRVDDKKMVGPGFQQVADKYAEEGTPNAVDTVAEHISKGGRGRWGKAAMPPQSAIAADDVKLLARWVLQHKKK